MHLRYTYTRLIDYPHGHELPPPMLPALRVLATALLLHAATAGCTAELQGRAELLVLVSGSQSWSRYIHIFARDTHFTCSLCYQESEKYGEGYVPTGMHLCQHARESAGG